MSTYLKLKRSLLYMVLLSGFAMLLTNCGQSGKADNAQVTMSLSEPVKASTKERDEKFLISAAEFDYEQILLGKLARQRATSTDVRDFAAMMEEDHRNAKSKIGSMGIIKSIAVPSAPTKSAYDAYDTLNVVSIEDFDVAYLANVIKSHHDAIRLFEGCANVDHDPDIKTLASQRLPDLRMHLAKAMELDAMFGPLSEAIR